MQRWTTSSKAGNKNAAAVASESQNPSVGDSLRWLLPSFSFLSVTTEMCVKVAKTPNKTVFFDFYEKICYNIYVR
jgi:hypothetical protein